ncbi:unnamed protein product [Symbiodinium natans]|uniref:Uncharacterized protein n=1 Tax=Symbiodinium natans TaxID=878477 RepID=A0A812TYR7_9DINO|nr:unnamed protein product [Symbiodinium natans]
MSTAAAPDSPVSAAVSAANVPLVDKRCPEVVEMGCGSEGRCRGDQTGPAGEETPVLPPGNRHTFDTIVESLQALDRYCRDLYSIELSIGPLAFLPSSPLFSVMVVLRQLIVRNVRPADAAVSAGLMAVFPSRGL